MEAFALRFFLLSFLLSIFTEQRTRGVGPLSRRLNLLLQHRSRYDKDKMCEKKSHSNDNGIGKVSMDVQSQIFGGMTRSKEKEVVKRKQGNK